MNDRLRIASEQMAAALASAVDTAEGTHLTDLVQRSLRIADALLAEHERTQPRTANEVARYAPVVLPAAVDALHERIAALEAAKGETQETVSAWAEQTFGSASSNARVAARANEEMAELLRCLTADDASPRAAAEVADVVIVLYRLATRLGVDLLGEIDRKMAVNRARKWALTTDGHGYHVRDKEK